MDMGPWAISDMWRNALPSTGWGPNDYAASCWKYGSTWTQSGDVRWRKACEEDAAHQMALESAI